MIGSATQDRLKKAGLLLVAVISLFSLFPLNSRLGNKDLWHSLLVKSPEKLNRMEQFLQEKGMRDISSSNLSVYYSDFVDLHKIPLNRLSDRLLPEDRRFDPVLKDISALFITDQGERVFFLSNQSPFEMFLALWSIRDDIIWEQSGGVRFIFGPLVFIFLIIAIIGLFNKDSILPLLILFSWLPFLYNSSYEWGIFMAPLIILEISLLERDQFKGYQITAIGSLLIIALLTFQVMHNFQLLSQIIVTLLLVYSTKYGILKKNLKKKHSSKVKYRRILWQKKTEHSLFEPVYFNREKHTYRQKNSSFYSERKSILLLVPFTLLLLFPFPAEQENHINTPPRESIVKHLDFQSSILYWQDWDSQGSVNEYKWDRKSGKIIVSPLDWKENMASMPPLNSEFIYTALLNPLFFETSLSFFTYQHFYKYIIFTIMTVFFLYTVLFLSNQHGGKDRLFYISTRRGRKVA